MVAWLAKRLFGSCPSFVFVFLMASAKLQFLRKNDPEILRIELAPRCGEI